MHSMRAFAYYVSESLLGRNVLLGIFALNTNIWSDSGRFDHGFDFLVILP